MRRDGWYAAMAAFVLVGAGAAFALVKAPEIADPREAGRGRMLRPAVPTPPGSPVDEAVLTAALDRLAARDPFAPTGDGGHEAPMLARARLGDPVRFSDPTATRTRTAEAPARTRPREAAARPAASAPPPQPSRPAVPAAPRQVAERQTGSMTLRGVYPTPQGGRALVAMPDGRVVSVGLNGSVGGWRVLDIRQDAIRLGRGQRAILLALPR